jgi:hypothetical protein
MVAGSAGTGKKVSAPGTPPVVAKKPRLRVMVKGPEERGTKFRVVVANGGADEVDITGSMTAPLAHALWQVRGGAEIENWVDAEGLLDQLLAPLALGVIEPKAAPAPPEVVIPGKRTTARR